MTCEKYIRYIERLKADPDRWALEMENKREYNKRYYNEHREKMKKKSE